jgi:hypothetical protein
MLLLVLALGAPASALGAPRDVAATHAFIEANYTLAKASVARIGVGQAKIERFNDKLAGECPQVGAGSPEDEASQPVAHEVAEALWSLAYGTGVGPVSAFVRQTSRLRWSSPAINRIASAYSRSTRELASLPLPDLCRDVRSWSATGFQVVPASTLSLVLHEEAIEPKPIPPRLLAPYERGSDATLLARTIRLEQRLEEQEFLVGQRDWVQVLETLGLNQ